MLGKTVFSFIILLVGIVPAYSQTVGKSECEWSRLATDGGGYVTSLALDKAHPDTVYCGSDKGGIHRSDDGGRTWKICTTGFDRETFYGISGILPDDKNPGRVYALSGTGWARNFFIKGGLWRSDDKGEHWRQMSSEVTGSGEGDGKVYGHVMDFDPADHNVIYSVCWNNGLWVSRDAGQTWKQLGFAGRYPTGVWADPDDSKRILVALRPDCYGEKPQPGGLFESVDAGKTWKKILDQATIADISRHDKKHDLLAAADGGKGLFISRDRGKTWEKLGLDKRCAEVRKVRWHPGKENRLWTVGGDRGLFYTDDFGKTWTWPTESIEKSIIFPNDWFMSARKTGWVAMAAVSDLVIDPTRPERMYSGDFFTPLLSTDGGKTWSQKPKGINTLCVYQVVCDPKDSNTIYVTNADVGLLKSVDGGKNFVWPIKEGEFSVNETHQLWVSPANNKHLILTVTYDWKQPSWNRVGISWDGGVTWDARWDGLPFKHGGYMTGLAVLDDKGQKIMAAYSGSDQCPAGVYLSINGGKTWKTYIKGLPTQPGLFGSGWGALPNLVVSGQSVYAATESQGLYRCEKLGKPWERVGEKKIPGRILTVAVAKDRPEWVWVGTESGLFVSSDQGKTWNKSGPAQMERCHGIGVDPFNSKRWFVAVSQPWWGSGNNVPGVYMTDDDGNTWSILTDMPCKGLAWHITCDPHRKGVIYIGTNGTGTWRGVVQTKK